MKVDRLFFQLVLTLFFTMFELLVGDAGGNSRLRPQLLKLVGASAGLSRRSVIILGSEGTGMTRALERLADATVCIPGSGVVESLNVAVAGGILLAEACRQPAGSPTRPPTAG